MGNVPSLEGPINPITLSNETGINLTCGEVKLIQVGGNRYCRYTFLCGYGPFSWILRCRFSEVDRLFNAVSYVNPESKTKPLYSDEVCSVNQSC